MAGFRCFIFSLVIVYKIVAVFCCVWLGDVTDAAYQRELGCATVPTSIFHFSCLQILQGTGLQWSGEIMAPHCLRSIPILGNDREADLAYRECSQLTPGLEALQSGCSKSGAVSFSSSSFASGGGSCSAL